MKIVKFKDGRYGIRKWALLGYRFLDLESSNILWWEKGSLYMSCCKSHNLDKVKDKFVTYKETRTKFLEYKKDMGEPI